MPMSRISPLILGIVLGACGCQTLAKPASETQVDQELIAKPAPNIPQQEPVQHEPRPGFEQEPQKSQSP